MSSTHRGATRSPNDFYVTDPKEITRFLVRWLSVPVINSWFAEPRKILDPAAGGLTEEVVIPPKQKVLDDIAKYCKVKELPFPDGEEAQRMIREEGLVFKPSEMSYPKALAAIGHNNVDTLDIRSNSRAAVKGDFLKMANETFFDQYYDMVITNPPFSLAIEFIEKSLRIVKPRGYVVMLLRLNFFGSEDRNHFFLSGNMPALAYVHAKRLGFTPDGKTDSIEYVHAIWAQGRGPCHETKLRVLPY